MERGTWNVQQYRLDADGTRHERQLMLGMSVDKDLASFYVDKYRKDEIKARPRRLRFSGSDARYEYELIGNCPAWTLDIPEAELNKAFGLS